MKDIVGDVFALVGFGFGLALLFVTLFMFVKTGKREYLELSGKPRITAQNTNIKRQIIILALYGVLVITAGIVSKATNLGGKSTEASDVIKKFLAGISMNVENVKAYGKIATPVIRISGKVVRLAIGAFVVFSIYKFFSSMKTMYKGIGSENKTTLKKAKKAWMKGDGKYQLSQIILSQVLLILITLVSVSFKDATSFASMIPGGEILGIGLDALINLGDMSKFMEHLGFGKNVGSSIK